MTDVSIGKQATYSSNNDRSCFRYSAMGLVISYFNSRSLSMLLNEIIHKKHKKKEREDINNINPIAPTLASDKRAQVKEAGNENQSQFRKFRCVLCSHNYFMNP